MEGLCLGTSGPISLQTPTLYELECNNDLLYYLNHRDDVFEDILGQEKRGKVVRKLSEIVRSWGSLVLAKQGASDEMIANGGGIQLRIFGSTRLGVHTPDADIDCLCIAPSGINRMDFFSSLCEVLQSRSDVNSIFPVQEAFTPVLKFLVDDQAVDMIFVSLQLPRLPENINILDGSLLTGLDEIDIRCLNGARVAECICALVPDMRTFTVALRAIKLWARQRAVYSNILGFLGGVSYAIMVAFVCQRFPNACPATIVEKFFLLFSHWQWQMMPVMLNAIEVRAVTPASTASASSSESLASEKGAASDHSATTHSSSSSSTKYIPAWNPKINPKDASHLMPIITPAYPVMNSAYNVGAPQFRYIQEEILRGQLVFQNAATLHRVRVDAMLQGLDVSDFMSDRVPWEALFFPAADDYFVAYSRYIQVDICADSDAKHRCWFGWCESRMKQLLISLEQPPFVFCHPQSNCYHQRLPRPAPLLSLPSGIDQDSRAYPSPEEDGEIGPNDITYSMMSPPRIKRDATIAPMPVKAHIDSSNGDVPAIGNCNLKSSYLIGLSFSHGLREANVAPPVEDFVRVVNSWQGKQSGMEIVVTPLTRDQIPEFVHAVKAQPSSISGCTPVKTRLEHNSGSRLGLSSSGLRGLSSELSSPARGVSADGSDISQTLSFVAGHLHGVSVANHNNQEDDRTRNDAIEHDLAHQIAQISVDPSVYGSHSDHPVEDDDDANDLASRLIG